MDQIRQQKYLDRFDHYRGNTLAVDMYSKSSFGVRRGLKTSVL